MYTYLAYHGGLQRGDAQRDEVARDGRQVRLAGLGQVAHQRKRALPHVRAGVLAALHQQRAQHGPPHQRLQAHAQALRQAADQVQRADDEFALGLDQRCRARRHRLPRLCPAAHASAVWPWPDLSVHTLRWPAQRTGVEVALRADQRCPARCHCLLRCTPHMPEHQMDHSDKSLHSHGYPSCLCEPARRLHQRRLPP